MNKFFVISGLLVPTSNLAFGDTFFIDTTDHPFSAEIDMAYSFRIIEGYPDRTFKPGGIVTREEVVSMVLGARAGLMHMTFSEGEGSKKETSSDNF